MMSRIRATSRPSSLGIEIAGGEWFLGARQEQREFGLFEELRIFYVEKVSENGGAWIAKRVGFGGVSQPLLPSHLVLDQGTALVTAGTPVEDAFHAFRELHAFDGADLFTLGAGQYEAPGFG
jgi:hypothetical protein